MQAPKFFKIIFPPPKFHSKIFFQKCSRKPQKNFGEKIFRDFLGNFGEKPEPAPALARGKGAHFLHFREFSRFFIFSWNSVRPWYVPSQTAQNRLGNPGPARPGFSKMGGKGTGRKRSVSVAGGLVGTGGKFRGGHFLVCSIARVFSAGFPKRGSKTPRFLPITEPNLPGCSVRARSSSLHPLYMRAVLG